MSSFTSSFVGRPRWTVVVLASGQGRRMGGPKAFKVYRGQRLIERVVQRCAEQGAAVRVTVDPRWRGEMQRVLAAHPAASGLRELVLVDADGRLSMWEALLCALSGPLDGDLDAADVGSGFWVWPVDAAFLAAEAWARAVSVVLGEPERIWKLCVGGRSGHPVWLPRWMLPHLLQDREGAPVGGLREVLAAFVDETAQLELPGAILWDANTPAELARIEAEA